VTAGGPAEKAGIKPGDVILEVNGKRVNDPNVLRNTVAAIPPDTEVTVKIARNGAEQDLKVKLTELTAEAAQAGAAGGGGEQGAPTLGVGVVPLTPELASELGLRRGTQGVVIQSVEPDGPAAEVGLQPGDVIQEVNRQPVRTPQEMRAALARSSGRGTLLLVNRQGRTQYVTVTPAR
jgi:S1-C subfamily serine protease